MALSAKQKIFINEYLQCWNAAEAARRAGYSEKSARSIGHENLTKPDIAEEIQRRVDELAMSANETLLRLAEQARAAYSAYMMPNGTVDLARLVADGKAHLIKGIKETKYGTEIEFYDAQSALVAIGKHHKLFTDKVEMEHSGSLDISADERAQAAKELEQWQQEKKNGGATSNG